MGIVQKAIIKKEDKILILKRSTDSITFPGFWDFPGGHIKDSEAPIDAIQREVYEETGLRLKAKSLIAEFSLFYNQISHRFVIYEMEEPDSFNVSISCEHSNFDWIPVDHLVELKAEPFIKYIIANSLLDGVSMQKEEIIRMLEACWIK